MNKILIIIILVVSIFANDKYILAFSQGYKGFMEYDAKTNKTKILIKTLEVYNKDNKIQMVPDYAKYINGKIIVALSKNMDVQYGELIDNKIKITNMPEIFAYLEEYKLYVGFDIRKLMLFDLNFKKVKQLEDDTFRGNETVLNGNKIIYTENIKGNIINEHYYNFMLYDVKTDKKIRLKKLEKYCDNVVAYRKNTGQLLCYSTSQEIRLLWIDIYGNNQEKINLSVKWLYPLYYDEKNDRIFYTKRRGAFFYIDKDMKFSFYREVDSFEVYNFKTKKSTRLLDNIYVKSMDKLEYLR